MGSRKQADGNGTGSTLTRKKRRVEIKTTDDELGQAKNDQQNAKNGIDSKWKSWLVFELGLKTLVPNPTPYAAEENGVFLAHPITHIQS
jgi:hypothetical protein